MLLSHCLDYSGSCPDELHPLFKRVHKKETVAKSAAVALAEVLNS